MDISTVFKLWYSFLSTLIEARPTTIAETSAPAKTDTSSSRAGTPPHRSAPGDAGAATGTALAAGISYRDATTRFPASASRTTATAVAAGRTTSGRVGPAAGAAGAAGRSLSPLIMSTARLGGGGQQHGEGLLDQPPLPWYDVKHLPVFERLCRGAPVHPDTPPDSPLGSSQGGGEHDERGTYICRSDV